MKIYYAKIEKLMEEELHIAMQLLPKERTDRIKRMKQKKSQIQSISAGLLLEYALQEIGLTGKTLTFLKNEDGKPYIKEYPNLWYNLSHSGEYVALAVDEQPIGVDIERIRRDHQKLVKRFFSEEEALSLADHWSDEVFTKLWTRKESYIKATGYGMRMPLDGFSTLEEQVKVNEKMPTEMTSLQVLYYLASFQMEEDYWMSVCRGNEPVSLKQSSVMPEKVDLKKILYM